MAKRATGSQLSPEGEALKKEGKRWLERIEAAWKREDDWAKDAEKAVKAYTNETHGAGEGKLYDYNILHSNVETIVPAIINSPPVPDIRRRFNDDDPVAKLLADIIERSISVQVDDSRMATELEGQAQDGFLAGRGVIRLRFRADTQETETSALAEAKDEADKDSPESKELASGGVGAAGSDGGSSSAAAGYDDQPGTEPVVAQPSISNERITFEAVSWRDYQHGPAKRWEDRPWESFRHTMQHEDVSEFADSALVASQSEPGGKLFGDADSDIIVYEIWDKRSRCVYFIDDNGHSLKKLEDPLGLANFFPTSRPVQPIEIVGRLMPVNPFSVYKRLADELDILTRRISIITEAMKVKGAFIGALGNDLTALANADDNELIAIAGIEAVAQMGGIDKAISWWPVDKFFPVLAELFKNRDLTKQAIYEITGISDIVRGASKASETLGAQQIKSQWGSLRIQKMQRMMERSARDLFVMMAEIIPAKFSHQTLEAMTGIPIALKPNDPPEVIQKKQQLHQLMKQKLTAFYRIDVESESTIRADLTMKKQESAEFLAASAAYFQAVGPLVQQGTLPAEMAIEIYAANARLFNLGKSIEDLIEQMVQQAKQAAEQAKANPQPKPPSPEEIKAQAEQQKGQLEQQKAQFAAQTAQAKSQADQAAAQVQIETIQAKAQADIAKINAAVEGQRLQSQSTIAESNAKLSADQQTHALEMQKGALELEKLRVEILKIQAGTQATIIGADAKAKAAETQQRSSPNGSEH